MEPKENKPKEILKNNEKVLRTKCDIFTPEDEDCIEELKKSFFYKNGRYLGVGIAANQIGITKRVCLITESKKEEDLFVMINPKIVRHGKQVVAMYESCLSKPKQIEKMNRYRVIDVEYFDENWNPVAKTFKSFIARIVQHELNHLDGLDCLKNILENNE